MNENDALGHAWGVFHCQHCHCRRGTELAHRPCLGRAEDDILTVSDRPATSLFDLGPTPAAHEDDGSVWISPEPDARQELFSGGTSGGGGGGADIDEPTSAFTAEASEPDTSTDSSDTSSYDSGSSDSGGYDSGSSGGSDTSGSDT